MGIELALFQVGIGLFAQAGRNVHVRIKGKASKYMSHTKGTDVHFRSFVCGLYLTFIFLVCYAGVAGQKFSVDYFTSTPFTGVSAFILDNSMRVNHCGLGAGIHTNGLYITNEMYGAHYGTFPIRLLRLSGDIEMNPGPGQDKQPSPETQYILDAINNSEIKITNEFKKEIRSLKMEMKEMKTKMEIIENHNAKLDQKVGEIESYLENVDHGFDDIYGKFHSVTEQRSSDRCRIEALEQQLYHMDSKQTKCSLRVFGLEERESESKSLIEVINEEILVLITDDEHSDEQVEIVSATRVGKERSKKPRMVIIEFKEIVDKVKLFKFRDILRRKNIKISNDLSYAQRQFIKRAYDRGERGYFKNGRFFTEPMRKRSEDRRNRGVRTLDDRNRELLRARANEDDHNDTVTPDPNTMDI